MNQSKSHVKSGVVYIKNSHPMKQYIRKLNSNDVYSKWVRMYLVLKSNMMICLYPDKGQEPFIDIKLSELKFDLLPVKIDDEMNYFTLKVYKKNNE
jgi:hypothetical protein